MKQLFNRKMLRGAGLCLVLLAGLSSCSDEVTDPPTPQPKGEWVFVDIPQGGFSTQRCRVLTIHPETKKPGAYSWKWTTGDSLLSETETLEFAPLNVGTYPIQLVCADTLVGVADTVSFPITVAKEAKAYSPYVASVPAFRPAPGQFVNELPEYEEGDTEEDMCRKAFNCIGNNAKVLISLGGYGGYVVCGFDHTIINVPGEYDFKVLGNAFWANANPNPNASKEGGSCEPGIVMVAYDRNKNGKADDDEWYELAGSEYENPKTVKDYSITYRRPSSEHEAVAPPANEASWNVDAEYIAWEDGKGKHGFIPKNIYHSQDYYPKWVDEDEMTFSGTLLPNNAVDESGQGTYWVQYAYPWGYADNGLNNTDQSSMKIDWAVDANGKSVKLPGIDFVKIYTGLNQHCGWLGETSTEVMGITDLHLTEAK